MREGETEKENDRAQERERERERSVKREEKLGERARGKVLIADEKVLTGMLCVTYHR